MAALHRPVPCTLCARFIRFVVDVLIVYSSRQGVGPDGMAGPSHAVGVCMVCYTLRAGMYRCSLSTLIGAVVRRHYGAGGADNDQRPSVALSAQSVQSTGSVAWIDRICCGGYDVTDVLSKLRSSKLTGG